MTILDIFQKVQWLDDSNIKTAPCFSTLKIKYGFTGKNEPIPSVFRPDQVHGIDIIKADKVNCKEFGKIATGDAIYTLEQGLPIAVITADCMPLLISDKSSNVFMAIHAGWRSLSGGIILEALNLIKSLGFDSSDLHILIGPTITASSYEVGVDVIDAFSSKNLDLTDEELSISILKGVLDKWSIDLQSIAVCLLNKYSVNLENVNVIRSCTFKNSDKWHSFRRDALRAGRNYNWIMR